MSETPNGREPLEAARLWWEGMETTKRQRWVKIGAAFVALLLLLGSSMLAEEPKQKPKRDENVSFLDLGSGLLEEDFFAKERADIAQLREEMAAARAATQAQLEARDAALDEKLSRIVVDALQNAKSTDRNSKLPPKNWSELGYPPARLPTSPSLI